MAADNDSDSDFSGFHSDDYRDIVVPDEVDSDISISPVSSPATSSDEWDSDPEDEPENRRPVPVWTDNLTAVIPPAFARETGPSFVLPPGARELDFFFKFFTINLIQ